MKRLFFKETLYFGYYKLRHFSHSSSTAIQATGTEQAKNSYYCLDNWMFQPHSLLKILLTIENTPQKESHCHLNTSYIETPFCCPNRKCRVYAIYQIHHNYQ